MPLRISDLKTALTGPTLEISPEFLQLGHATDLFTRFFNDAMLRVNTNFIDLEALVIVGSVPIIGQAPSDTRVVFLADDAEEYLVGIRIDVVLLPTGPGLPPELAHIPTALEQLGLGPQHLVFGIEPDGGSLSDGASVPNRPRIGLGIELLFPNPAVDPRPYVWAYPPAKADQPWNFFGVFDDVPLSGLDDLHKLSDGNFDLPEGLIPDNLRLNALAFDIIPADAALKTDLQWLSLGIGLKLAGKWEIWPNVLTVENLDTAFTVSSPLSRPMVSVVVGGRVELANEIRVDVTVMLPNKSLAGNLASRLEIGTVLKGLFGEIPLLEKLAVSHLIVSAEMSNDPGYALDLTLDNVLPVVEGLMLSKVNLRVMKEASQVTATIDAAWQLGDKAFDVVGTWSSGSGWTFTATAPSPGIALTDVLAQFDLELPDIPHLLNPTVVRLSLRYEPTGKSLVIHTVTEHFELAFVSLPESPRSDDLDSRSVLSR
ncbi:hypothetical protein ACIP5Y_07030 [Nocardia sp. NPDC088792]|uniref:hypothetical protein n=1 Tax=Nocardia sp. NPDC088792 TaxID=3364332 RepID=UPI00382C0BAE